MATKIASSVENSLGDSAHSVGSVSRIAVIDANRINRQIIRLVTDKPC